MLLPLEGCPGSLQAPLTGGLPIQLSLLEAGWEPLPITHCIGPSCGPRGIRSFKGWAQWPGSASCCFLGLHASQEEGAPRGMFKAGQGPNVLCHFPLIFLTCGSEATHLWDQGFPKGTPLPTGVRKPWAGLLGLGMGVCTRRCYEWGELPFSFPREQLMGVECGSQNLSTHHRAWVWPLLPSIAPDDAGILHPKKVADSSANRIDRLSKEG